MQEERLKGSLKKNTESREGTADLTMLTEGDGFRAPSHVRCGGSTHRVIEWMKRNQHANHITSNGCASVISEGRSERGGDLGKGDPSNKSVPRVHLLF